MVKLFMKDKIRLLEAKIISELNKIEDLKDELDGLKETLNLEKPSNFEKAAIGYSLHNFYNGCENIFKNISQFFENNFTTNRYHRELLERMILEIEGIRPRVISDELFLILEDFLGFRHKFRHSYSFELDWDREKLVLNKFDKAFNLLNKEINKFIKLLKAIRED